MTDDNTKDWAPIRIEEPVRDDASDADPTYTSIMRAGLLAIESGLVTAHPDGTVTETKRALDGLEGADGGDEPDVRVSNDSEKLDAILNHLEMVLSEPVAEVTCDGIDDDLRDQLDEIQRTVEQNNGALGDTVEQALNIGEHGFTDIVDRLDRIESAAEAAEERTGSIQNALENEGAGR